MSSTCSTDIGDLIPFPDDDGISVVHPTIDILEQFAVGAPPTFSIISNTEYVSQFYSNSSSVTHTLPQQFLISLSYKPNTNTILRLLTAFSKATPESAEDYAMIMLSSALTYLQQYRYLDLLRNISTSVHHTLTLVVRDGALGVCMDGEYRPAEPFVNLWNRSQHEVEMVFSDQLHSVASAVSVCVAA